MSNTVLTLLSAERLKLHYGEGLWRDETIFRLAAEKAKESPAKIAITERLRRISYGDLVKAAEVLADELDRAGVRRGQRVACWLPSRIETAVALLACARNGYVLCTSLHRDHTVGDVAKLIERMNAAGFIYETGYGADARELDIEPLVAKLAHLKYLRKLAPVAALKEMKSEWQGAQPSQDAIAPVDSPDSAVYLAFTSGTTGLPKGVLHSDNTLLSNARALAKDWSFGSADVIYTLSPLSHNLGFGAMILSILVGGELVVHDLAKGGSLLDRIAETKTSFLFGVPTHAIDLLAEMRARKIETLQGIRGFRISGASVTSEVVAELMRKGIPPQSGYGMTEACSHHYTLPSDEPSLITQTSGRACPGYEIRIFSEENLDKEVPAGQIGQIGGRGTSLMLGYFDDQTATENSFNKGGWFMTGDLGWLDEKGYLHITGRKKDLIIRGGHNIYPARIEELASRHPAIKYAAALPVADERLGEKVCIAVTLKDGESIDPKDLLAHLSKSGLSKFDMPEYFVELDAFPLTASGKVLKRDIVALVQSGQVHPTPVRWTGAAQ